jgi:hypothetical protein
LAIDFNDGVNTYTSIAYSVEGKDCAQAKTMAKCLAVAHPSIEHALVEPRSIEAKQFAAVL